MTPDREFQILDHIYGRNDGKVTALAGRWATEADDPHLIGHWEGCWVGPGIEYHPDDNELIITRTEARALEARKLIVFSSYGIGSSAQGRDHWRRIKGTCP